jgi:RNase P subunit RPR2
MAEPIEIVGCCDNVDITSGNTYVRFGKWKYDVKIVYCKNCGSKKATSYIKEFYYKGKAA